MLWARQLTGRGGGRREVFWGNGAFASLNVLKASWGACTYDIYISFMCSIFYVTRFSIKLFEKVKLTLLNKEGSAAQDKGALRQGSALL